MFQLTEENDPTANIDQICWHIIQAPNAKMIEVAMNTLIENLRQFRDASEQQKTDQR